MILKILILSHTREYSNFKIGSHHYANGFIRKGHEVTFLGSPYTLSHKLMGKKKDEGVYQLDMRVNLLTPYMLFPIKNKNGKLFDLINYFFCKVSIKDNMYDLIVCDNPYFYPYINIFNYKKMIYRPTDDYFKFDGEVANKYEKKITGISDLIISTSLSVKRSIDERFKPSCGSIVLENGYDAEMFKSVNNKDRSGAIYIGAVDERFDLDAISILAKVFPEDKFNIYGPIIDSYKQKVKEITDIYENIIFYGAVDYNQTPDIMQKAKIGLLTLSRHPSNHGRSPMKLWEYAASGLAVIYSNIDLNEVKNVGFLWEYNNDDELIKCYEQAKSNYFLDKRIVEVIEEHSWSNNIDRIQSQFNKLA
ncbi:hypothetical protein MC50_026210 [Raoultella planticola]|nr:hypothetical protein MC50_026210 [Raoultella planticola]PNK80070.1 hypothetical protein CEP62_019265 [Raoultella planticola]